MNTTNEIKYSINDKLEEIKDILIDELKNDKKSLNQLAHLTDISVNQLSLIKRSKSRPTQLSTLYKLADYYDYDFKIEVNDEYGHKVDLSRYDEVVNGKFLKVENDKNDPIYHNIRQIIEYSIEKRNEFNLSQREFATKINLSQANVGLIEKYLSNPNLSKIEKIITFYCAALNIIFKKKG